MYDTSCHVCWSFNSRCGVIAVPATPSRIEWKTSPSSPPVGKPPGQRWPAIASLAAGRMTSGASLFVQALASRDRGEVGAKRVAGRVGLLPRRGDGECGDRTGEQKRK
jgi:hypothetical protein